MNFKEKELLKKHFGEKRTNIIIDMVKLRKGLSLKNDRKKKQFKKLVQKLIT